jgi:hypothetical protein
VVDIVLGVSMAPTKVRMVLVEGESADGVTVDQDDFDVTADSLSTAPAQVISAILGTREGAAEGGYQLLSIGVTWTHPVEAAALRDALAAYKIENVMLVSAFMAAAALAQAIGNATNYARTALLFVEPYTATLAVVNTADGSITDVHRQLLDEDEDQAVAELVEMLSRADSLEARPDGVFVVGSGVDVPLIKPALEAATSLALSVSDEPEMALAQGAALASANAPLFASSTVARAYALDTGTGYRPEFCGVPYLSAEHTASIDNVAYSAAPDDDIPNEAAEAEDAELEEPRRRGPVLLLGSTLSVIVISAVVALEIALAIGIRPTVALRPSPNENIIIPTAQAPAPAFVPQPEIKPPAPVAVPRPFPPPVAAPVRPAPPVPVPAGPPPVLVPVAPVPVPAPEPPLRLLPRGPLAEPPRGPLAEPPRGLFGEPPRGPLARVPEPQAPREQGPLPRLGGGHGGFGGPFGGFGPFGGGHGGFGGPFGGGHGFGGPFGGFGRR